MTEALRPSTLGEILDRTTQLYRRNFWLFAGTAAMPMAVAFGLMMIAIPAGVFAVPGMSGGGDLTNAIRTVAFVIAFLVFVPVYLAVYVFAIAGITQGAISANRGEKLTIRAALKSAAPRFWTYLWYLILQGFMAAFAPMMLALVVIGPLIYLITRPGVGVGSAVGLGFVMVLVGAAALGAIIWLALSYAMGFAACVAEKKTAWDSLMRSYRLSEGTRGRIFVLFLLIMVLSMVVSMFGYIVSILVGAVAAFMGRGSAMTVVGVIAIILYAVVTICGQIVLQPVSWIALVLFYYDQRIRKEGFDIEWMMEQAGMTPPPPYTAPMIPSPQAGVITPPSTPPDTLEER